MKLLLDPMESLLGTAAMSMWVCIYLLAFAQNIQTVFWYQEDELTMNSLQWIRDPWSFTIQTQLMWSNTFLTLLLVSAWLSSVDMLGPQLKLWSSKLGLFLHHPHLQVLDPCVWNLGWPMDSVMSRAVWKVSVKIIFCAVLSFGMAVSQTVISAWAEDVAYSSFYMDSDYPVTKVLRDPVYVEVRILERTDPNLVLTLGRCWATSSPYPHSLPQWDLLIDG